MPWSPGQVVRHVDDPAKVGTVTDQTRKRASGLQYRVNWNFRMDWHYADELVVVDEGGDDLFELIRKGHYGRVEDLRRLLTHIHLSGRLTNVVYSMGLTQTDFYPHQYKPLLTLLDSPTNGLLIADEVGLGKTIEAGLIWTELRARYDMRRLLVVCPASLREKWRLELSKRFGVVAHVVDAARLLNDLALGDHHREQAWIVSYHGIRVPREWDSDEINTPKTNTRQRFADFLLQHADGEQLFDLVIFDEAHYMRNDKTNIWRTASLLRDVCTHQVMLSATPINLGSNDLFNVLRLLDPDHFGHPEDFRNILEANRPVIAASEIIRNPYSGTSSILEAIREIASSRWFKHSGRVDRLIAEASKVRDWTYTHRIEFAAKLERLNLIAHIVTRTRKKEVQAELAVREVTIFEAEMTSVEWKFYQAITDETRKYATIKDTKHGFLLSTPQRMTASCPAALLRTWSNDWLDDDVMSVLMDETEEDETRLIEASSGFKQWLASRVLHEFGPEELMLEDSKYVKFSQAIKQFLDTQVTEKALVFTTFRGTARYLVDRLMSENIQAELLMGGAEFDKETIVENFRNDPVCRVLVCTDVAAEGVDLQFCRLVVNYDLPWNPMRIEQRIGRIDRLGQESKRILVWNFVHKDTIDARILSRLTERIGIFESTLGATGEILGQVRKLEDLLFSRHLTPEEETRLIEEVALAIANIKRKQEELEREAIQLVAHGQHLLAQIESARGDGKIVTRQDLIRYIDGWIKNMRGCRFVAVHNKEDTFEIQLSSNVAAEFDEYLRHQRLIGKTQLSSGQSRYCRFTDRITDKPKPGEDIIHRFHPLVRFISSQSDNDEECFPLYASRVSCNCIPPTICVLYAAIANFSGIKDEDRLLVESVPLNGDSPLDSHTSEALLDAIRKSGVDWPGAENDVKSNAVIAAVDRCEDLIQKRYKELRDNKKSEYSDRANLLMQILDDHINKKENNFKKRIDDHEIFAKNDPLNPNSKRRMALASAERKKLDNFLARMETRRTVLERQSKSFSAKKRDICVIVVDVI